VLVDICELTFLHFLERVLYVNFDSHSGDLSFDRAYRGFYLINWVYRYFTEPHYRRWISKFLAAIMLSFAIHNGNVFLLGKVKLSCACVFPPSERTFPLVVAWMAGIVQTALYADFFYYYFKRYYLATFFLYVLYTAVSSAV
jgi:ER lumen protein retaining receptor